MDISNINSDLIRGNVTTIILRSLQEEARYGYDILKEIEVKSEGQYKLKQPTLYSCLKRLEKQGLIFSYWGEIDQTEGGRRRYYALSETGKAFLQKMQSEYEYSRTILDRLLSEKEYDFSSPAPFDINSLRPYTKRKSGDEDDEAAEKVQSVERAEAETEKEQAAEPLPVKEEIVAPEVAPVEEKPAVNNVRYEQLSISEEAQPVEEEKTRKSPVASFLRPELTYKFDQEAVEKAEEKQAEANAFDDTAPRKVNTSFNEMLSRIDNKIGKANQNDLYKNIGDTTPVYSADESVKREYYRPEKLTQNEIRYPSEPAKPAVLTEEQKRARIEAAQKLGIGEYANTENFNLQRYGIEAPQKKKEVLADDNGEDPALQKPSQIDNLTSEITETPSAVQPAKPPVAENYSPTDADALTKPADEPKKPASDFSFKKDDVSVNYKDAFYDFYNRSDNASLQDNVEIKDEQSKETVVVPPISSADLKTRLYAKGYKMSVYSRNTTESYYSQNFILASKLNRDCYSIMFLLLIIEVMACWLICKERLSTAYYIGICGIGFIVPLCAFIAYMLNPDKRVRASFNIKTSLLNRLMLYLNVLVLILLIGFFGFAADIKDTQSMLAPIIIPAVLFLDIPVSSLIYWALYRSNKYHIA